MPRRKAGDGAPAAPKAPRARKKKVNPEEIKPQDSYDPMIQGNGYMDGMEGGMYHHHEYGAFQHNYGQPPPFGSPEPSNSPYIMPQQSNTPQPNMIMRSMPQATAPTPLGPAPSALEFRIHEMNRRLYIFSSTGISESDHQQWWDAFSHEFFDDDCKLWFLFGDETTEREKYCLGRNSIPRFFRSLFDSGIRELLYVLRGPSREGQTSAGVPVYENESVLQVTKYDGPAPTEVNTECKLYAEFTPYDELLNHRIRSWTLELKQCDEFVYEMKNYEGHAAPERRSSKTTMGFFEQTIRLLDLAKILEPMQMIMGHAKTHGGWNSDPRGLMRRAMFQHFHEENTRKQELQMRQMNAPAMVMQPPEPEKPKPTRKRQRKPAANSKAAKKAAAAANASLPVQPPNASPAPSNPGFQPNPMNQPVNRFNHGYQDVMIVGEPSMMGGDFGDEDERTISRVENSQYDANSMQMQQMGQGQAQQQQMGHNGPQQTNLGMGPSPMGPPQTQPMGGGMSSQQMGQPMPPPMSSSINSINPHGQNPMLNPMHPMHNHQQVPHSMAGGMGNPLQNAMSNQMQNSMNPGGPGGISMPMPNSMSNPMSNPMSLPMSNPMSIPMTNQMSSSMPNSMPNGMGNPMPMGNSMPPGYSFQPQQQWQQPPNSAMITG